MKVAVIKKSDGTIDIMTPMFGGPTLEEIIRKELPTAEYEILESANMPHDRTFRNAWGINKGKIYTDLVKAKPIAEAKINKKEKLELLDILSDPSLTDEDISIQKNNLKMKKAKKKDDIAKAKNEADLLLILNAV